MKKVEPIEVFSADNEGKYIVLCCRYTEMCLTGTTMSTSITRPRVMVDEFAIFPKKGEEGIVAVKTAEDNSFILLVDWLGEKPNIHLKKSDGLWEETEEYVQIVAGEFEIEIKGEKYTTDPNGKKNGMHVVDGNVLCHYLVGHITTDLVKASAKQIEEKALAREELPEPKEKLTKPEDKDKQIEWLTRRIDILDKVGLEHTEKFLAFKEIEKELEEMRAGLKGSWRKRNLNTRMHLVKINDCLSRISDGPRTGLIK